MAKVQVRAANVNAVPEGRVLRVDLERRPILLSRCGEHFAAIDAICSHAGGGLEDGEIDEACMICPIHGAWFDLATGKASAETDWAEDLETFCVVVDGEHLVVEMTPRAAVCPVNPPADAVADRGCPWSGAAKGIDFDPMMPEQCEVPYGLYTHARREMPIFYSERFDLWIVTCYHDIVTILKDVARFSSAQSLALDSNIAPEVQAVLDTGYPATPTMVTADPPVHTRFRELVGKAFTSRRVAEIEPRMYEIAHKTGG
jgi:nitrite reductase/ring-hydroxylating ferredoxin subunit